MSDAKSVAAAFRQGAAAQYRDHLTKVDVQGLTEDGTPIKVYGKKPTLAQRSKIISAAGDSIHEQALRTVIELAMNEAGDRLFTIEDLHFLRTQVEADLIEWLAAHLNAGQSYEAVKKN